MSGPAAQYLAKYNNYTLPGYVQDESFDSMMNIADYYAPYADGSPYSEYTGLQNKQLSLTMKVWEDDYLACKTAIQQAATMLRSKRQGFAPLYVQYTNKYYMAQVGKVSMEKQAGTSVKTADYQVQFQCYPWLIGETLNSFNHATLITTTGRTIDDGGWTPATVTISGTNVTVSGYTATEPFTGYFSVSGAVTNLVVNSDAYTATIGGVNQNLLMRNLDYPVFVGPEVTNFAITGASACTIEYQNRWYI